MKRVIDFLRSTGNANDAAGVVLLVAIGVSTAVAVSVLFSQSMADAALKRFHLASESYPAWALQQCVPRMYNFENKVWFVGPRSSAAGSQVESKNDYQATVNHFPARHITYGDLRAKQFKDADEASFKMRSSFRGRHLTSIWQVSKDFNGVLRIQRLSGSFESDGGKE